MYEASVIANSSKDIEFLISRVVKERVKRVFDDIRPIQVLGPPLNGRKFCCLSASSGRRIQVEKVI